MSFISLFKPDEIIFKGRREDNVEYIIKYDPRRQTGSCYPDSHEFLKFLGFIISQSHQYRSCFEAPNIYYDNARIGHLAMSPIASTLYDIFSKKDSVDNQSMEILLPEWNDPLLKGV